MITESPVLDRFLYPVRQCLTPALARQLVEFRFDRQIQARIDELASKCNEGEMSEAERNEYEAYIEEADLIALLQAKARSFLEQAEK